MELKLPGCVDESVPKYGFHFLVSLPNLQADHPSTSERLDKRNCEIRYPEMYSSDAARNL